MLYFLFFHFLRIFFVGSFVDYTTAVQERYPVQSWSRIPMQVLSLGWRYFHSPWIIASVLFRFCSTTYSRSDWSFPIKSLRTCMTVGATFSQRYHDFRQRRKHVNLREQTLLLCKVAGIAAGQRTINGTRFQPHTSCIFLHGGAHRRMSVQHFAGRSW